MIDLFLACVKLGVIFVPVNILYREREIAHIVGDAEPAAVITAADLAADGRGMRGAAGESRPAVTLDGDAPAGIIYTSGTTGASKGAVLTHNNFAANAINLLACWQITAADRLLLALPLFHVHALGNGLHCWLMSGCRMRLLRALRAPEPRRRRSSISGRRSSSACRRFTCGCSTSRRTPAREIGGFDAAVRLRVRAARRAGVRGIPRALRAHHPGALRDERDAHEHRAIRTWASGAPGTVGLPLPGVSARIVEGEIQLKGPNVFAGYWRRDEATRGGLRRRLVPHRRPGGSVGRRLLHAARAARAI